MCIGLGTSVYWKSLSIKCGRPSSPLNCSIQISNPLSLSLQTPTSLSSFPPKKSHFLNSKPNHHSIFIHYSFIFLPSSIHTFISFLSRFLQQIIFDRTFFIPANIHLINNISLIFISIQKRIIIYNTINNNV